MVEHKNKPITSFTDDTVNELKEKREHAEEQQRHHTQEAEKWGKLVVNLDIILAISNNGRISTEKTILSPTEFVMSLLNATPDRWIPVREFLFKGRTAFEKGQVSNRSGTIENSIHSVLTRLRVNQKVFTKGKRETRKYKLKP